MRKFVCILSIPLFFAACTSCHKQDDQIVALRSCNQPLYPPLDTVIFSHTAFAREHYPKRISAFQADSISPGSIVMLGNSLTEEGGNWSSRLDFPLTVNRGIKGDNTDGVAARLGEIICAQPLKVFVMIGTNDLWTSYSAARIADQISSIGQLLAEELPDSEVYVQTIMPLGANHEQQGKLKEINQVLKTYSGNKYMLIDTFDHMANESGALPANFTTDGVHLTGAGYRHWAEFLKSFIHQM